MRLFGKGVEVIIGEAAWCFYLCAKSVVKLYQVSPPFVQLVLDDDGVGIFLTEQDKGTLPPTPEFCGIRKIEVLNSFSFVGDRLQHIHVDDAQELELFEGLAMVSGFSWDKVGVGSQGEYDVDGGELTLEVQVCFCILQGTCYLVIGDWYSLQSGRVEGES